MQVCNRMIRTFLALVMLAVFLFPAGLLQASAESAAALYVSPDGDDAAAGTIDAPLKTPEGAKAHLRAHREDFTGGATVYFREGVYTVQSGNRPLIDFTGEDLPNVKFCAYENESVTFSAAAPLEGFTETEVNGVKAFTLKPDLRFNALYHPDRVIKTPRYPEMGNFTVKGVEREDELFPDNRGWWEASNGCTAFLADREEIGVVFSQPEEVYCRITHAWLDEIARIRFYAEETGKVGLGRPATYEVKPGDVYWFENVFEALDAPGEWYLNENGGTLYYIPFEGETAADLTLYAPVSQYLMEIDGCSSLTFENIRFSGTEWTLSVPPADGGTMAQYDIDAYQASTFCDAAVNVQNADGIVFRNCEFTDIGNTAVKFIKNCHDCTVENCLFRQIGSTAIAVYGENVEPDAENANEAMSGFSIKNNLIEAYGRNTYESTGVHLMYVKDSEVRHNEIRDGFYTGLSCGWIWGHEYQVTKNVQITDNLICDIGQGWLSDLGGMYLLGEQAGTLIARNVIYNVTRGLGVNDYGGNGIYTDAGSSYFTIEQNLIYDCAANGLNIGGYNRDHTVRSNIVAFCKLSAFDPGLGDGRDDDHTCDCTGNVFYAENAPVLLNVSENAKYTEHGNLLWDAGNGGKVFGSDGYSGNYARKVKISRFFAERNGFMSGDTVADPLFTDPENRDFTLSAASPALDPAFGFTPWDYTAAGLLSDTAVGCGSSYERGSCSRVSDLSAYPNACSEPGVPYMLKYALKLASVVLLLLGAGFAVYTALPAAKKKDTKLLIKTLTPAVACLAALALLPLLKRFFVASWTAWAYGLCLALFMAAASLPAFYGFRNKILRILLIVVCIGVSLGATFLINNVLHAGEELALNAGTTVMAAFACLGSAKPVRQNRKQSGG